VRSVRTKSGDKSRGSLNLEQLRQKVHHGKPIHLTGGSLSCRQGRGVGKCFFFGGPLFWKGGPKKKKASVTKKGGRSRFKKSKLKSPAHTRHKRKGAKKRGALKNPTGPEDSARKKDELSQSTTLQRNKRGREKTMEYPRKPKKELTEV